MSDQPILYSFRRCPYAMRARMALHISDIALEHREILLRDKPAEMLEASPKGTVPVLILPSGEALEESLDVMHWALAQYDPEGWLDRHDERLITANDGSFKQALDRYKYPTRYDDVDDASIPRDSTLPYLQQVNARLLHQPYLSGEQRGFTDIAIFPFLRQFANTDRAWFDAMPLPALQKWLSEMLASDLFAAIMVKHPLWKAEQSA